jgi:two-component system probable response regulator PhcQ
MNMTDPAAILDQAYDYKKYAILYVDDEEMSLKYFTRAFGDQFRVLTAPGASEGLQVLEAHKDEIGILITDQRMPGEKGTWLLEKARALRPRILRILATAFSDMEAAISAVNSGAIYKYISKPWDPPQLEALLKRGLEFFMVEQERDQLLREKVSVLRNMMIADRIVSLGLLAAGLSHHIRNSLVAVKTFLDLAPAKLEEEKLEQQSMRNPEFWRDYYGSVQSQIERINNLLKDLWSVSETPQHGFRDRVKLDEIVDGSVSELRESLAAKRIQVANKVPHDLPGILVDKPKFLRLFDLLLKDELATLPEGSKVTFSARVAPGGSSKAPHIELKVRDNGPGLPQESLRLVFDPFVIRSDTPLEYGINLMACYFIVHHHGGEISAHSEPGRGTTFVLHLPCDPNQPLQELDTEFLQKVVLSDRLWEKLLAER